MTVMEHNAEAQTVRPEGDSNARFATFLRWFGAGAVGISGLLYLLQGLENIDGALRNWIYIGLMAILVGGGLVSRLTLKDAKGARLFFALAAAVVPVQFAQLGGMIHELVAVDSVGLWPDSVVVTTTTTALVGAVTALLLVPVAYSGFSVLARGEARRLTLAFSALNGLLLIPARDSLLGIAVLGVLAAAALILERRYFAAKESPPVFRTAEGGAVRAMFLLPLSIAATRFGLHVEALWGYCALGALFGTTLVFSGTWTRNRGLVEIATFTGISAIALSWWIFAQDVIWTADRTIAYPYMAAFAPIALFLFIGAERSPTYARYYRGAASVLLTVLSLQVLVTDHAVANGVLMVLAGVPLATWGLIRKHREPLLGGAVIATAGFCAAIAASVEHTTVNSWVLFAGLGVALVLVSSVVERYGKRAWRSTLDAWADVRGWE